MKYFVVTDVHGHASILKSALSAAEFVSGDASQTLVLCGDCFDRGPENVEMYKFLRSIPNKVIVCGNHEDNLVRALRRGFVSPTDVHNGTDVTITEFCGNGSIDELGKISTTKYRKKQLLDFAIETVDYFETQNYVFVHGWIAENNELTNDWRNATKSAWKSARWYKWMEKREQVLLSGKTIVCGHRAAKYASTFDTSRDPEDSSIYYGDGYIVMDSNTVRSKNVNVLVIDDEPISNIVHSMKLRREFFDKVARGSKTVEMRLFDEKRKNIKVGDTIVFTCEDNTLENVTVQVIGTHVYQSFGALCADFDARALGFDRRKTQYISQFMSDIYSEPSIAECGVMAIRIKLLK